MCRIGASVRRLAAACFEGRRNAHGRKLCSEKISYTAAGLQRSPGSSSRVTGGGAGFNIATAAVTHVVAAGQRLKAYANITGGQIFSMECSVVGDLLAS
jgi:hypothetical protein